MASAGKDAASVPVPEPEQFPVGLKVLVVDDDVVCLKILKQMLRKCLYSVTTCSQATVALNLLREKKGFFDIVLSDVHMPDMDGFKLLELVGLEMDLPFIMMSGDGRTSLVMKGIKHGACDYLIKPIRIEELKNIWQHVMRKKCNVNKEHELSGSLKDNDQQKHGTNPCTSKKPRVVWSVELHQQFVSAINQLGIDKAMPERILELMNVPGLTRENVADQLQKYKYLKRLSGASRQIPLKISGDLPSYLFNSPRGNVVLPAMDQSALLPASLPVSKCSTLDQNGDYGQPLMKCPSNIPSQYSQNFAPADNAHLGLGTSSPIKPVNVVACDNLTGLGSQNGSMMTSIMHHHLQQLRQQHEQIMTSIMHQQLRQQHEQQQKQCTLPEPSRAINVQPSCLVVPPHSSTNFQAAKANQNCSFGGSSIVDCSMRMPQSKNSPLDVEHKQASTLGLLSGTGSLLPTTCSSGSLNVNNAISMQIMALACLLVLSLFVLVAMSVCR